MNNGYYEIGVDGKTYLLHRYLWMQAFGEIPDGYDIHHIDGDKTNNDLSNLQCLKHEEHLRLHMTGNQINKGRVPTEETKKKMSESQMGKIRTDEMKVNYSQAKRKEGIKKNNSSGFKGVFFDRRDLKKDSGRIRKRWFSKITVGDNRLHLGFYLTAVEAAMAYDKAATEYFGRDCFVNFPQDNLTQPHDNQQ